VAPFPVSERAGRLLDRRDGVAHLQDVLNEDRNTERDRVREVGAGSSSAS
jgi:hypothetical protein